MWPLIYKLLRPRAAASPPATLGPLNSGVAMLNNSIAYYPDWKSFGNAERYCTSDDLYSIVKLLSTTEALIPLWCYEVKEDKELKKLKQLSYKAEPRLHKAYSLKALEDLPETDRVQALLENPNERMSKFEFFEFIYSSLNLQGEAFIVKQRPEMGVNAGKTVQMFPLYPQFIVMKVSNEYPREVLAYDYVVEGITLMENLPVEDVIHIKYFNPNFSINGSELRGLSPVKVLTKRNTRMDAEMSISVGQLQNGGVPTIVWDKTHYGEAAPEVMGQRKSNFYNYLNNSQGAPYFSPGEMGSIPTGLKLADMEVAALDKIDFKKLCNAYSVSDILFNNDSASTESNVKEMTKRLYTNAALPNVFRVRDALIKGLLPDFTDKKRFIQADISEIPELQEDSKDMAQWLNTAWWITPNEKREMQKFDKLEDPVFDSPLIPVGVQTLEDLAAIPDIEQVTENGN